jgi:hypothetical protein
MSMTISHSMAFETRGPSRGSCGHVHPDVESALRCLRADQAACDAAGAFSDRQIVPIQPIPPRGERLAAIQALHEVEGLYRDGALPEALQRLGDMPEVTALADVMDLADVQRWIRRAATRIRRESGYGAVAPAPVTACLRAAANIIARAG